MFTAAVFSTAKIWKQSKCPSIGEWIKKKWYIYTYHEILLSHKKINFAICNYMNGLRGWAMPKNDQTTAQLHPSHTLVK